MRPVRLGLILLALAGAPALAHAAVPEAPEVYRETEARLFVLDNGPGGTQVLALDLPRGEVVARISLPPRGMSMVPSPSGQHLLVGRGRDTDRQWLSVIWTGKEEGGWRRPVLAKSLLLGRGWNIGHGQKPYTLGDRLVAFAERDGVAYFFSEEALHPLRAFEARTWRLPNPDHYHIVEAPEGVYLALLARGQVLLYDRDLQEAKASFPCPVQHGEGFDPGTGRSFFACAREVLILEGGKEVARLPYPGRERIGAFHKGEGVFFGYSDGVTALQRLDLNGLSLTPIPLGGSLIWMQSAGTRLLVLLKDGRFQLREGGRDGSWPRPVLPPPSPTRMRTPGGPSCRISPSLGIRPI